MQRYGARLLFEGMDEFGPVEVVETADARRLHFGNEVEQSRSFVFAPESLGFEYFRAMAAGLLFQPVPERILILGLGGGSMARWLHDRLPGSRIDAVELRPLVRDVAYRYFGLPRTHRLTVHVDDATSFVRRIPPGEYDLVLVDVYDHQGMVESTGEWSFLGDCRRALSATGVMGINIWRENLVAFSDVSDQIEAAFEGQSLYLPLKSTANTIAFGFASNLPARSQVKRHAAELGELPGVDLRQLVKRLKHHNPGRI